MEARAAGKKNQVFGPFEPGRVSGDHKMEIRSNLEFFKEGKFLGDATGGDQQVAATRGQTESVENPLGRFPEFPEDRRDEWMLFLPFAYGFSLDTDVCGKKEFAEFLDYGAEAEIFLQVGVVYPVPGEVFHEDGGDSHFLAQGKPEGGYIAKDEFGI